MLSESISLWMFGVAMVVLMLGYPVAFSLAGTALGFAVLGHFTGDFNLQLLGAFPQRIYGTMANDTLIAVPLFVFMGVMLERAKIAEDLLETMGLWFGRLPGGIGISVCIVGALLATSTGIAGADVVAMGLISLPTMLKYGYNVPLASGLITASGTLGQIIPPSIILIMLGDVINSASQQAQLEMGSFSIMTVSVGDLFLGAFIPGWCLALLYMLFIAVIAIVRPSMVPPMPVEDRAALNRKELLVRTIKVLLPPFLLIPAVLGTILLGIATPTEGASFGCIGSILLAAMKRELNLTVLRGVMQTTTRITCMVFMILIGTSLFSLVFRGYGGDELVGRFLQNLHGGKEASFILVMAVMFVMGFFLDFFEIIFIVVPIVGPSLIMMGFDPLWLGVAMGINLQTSFLTPPFGFSLFYFRGVAPASVTSTQIYKGVIPFIFIQFSMLVLLWFFPQIVTWLPQHISGSTVP
ncbi:TRAP transporter large permease subunit [Deltaproteobacteria bacterium TL4]